MHIICKYTYIIFEYWYCCSLMTLMGMRYAAVFFIQVGVALLGAEPMHKEPRWRCWSARRAPSQVPVMS